MVLYYGNKVYSDNEPYSGQHFDSSRIVQSKEYYKMPEKSTTAQEINMTIDDKLNRLYVTLNSHFEATNNYILICILILVIIAIKLYK